MKYSYNFSSFISLMLWDFRFLFAAINETKKKRKNNRTAISKKALILLLLFEKYVTLWEETVFHLWMCLHLKDTVLLLRSRCSVASFLFCFCFYYFRYSSMHPIQWETTCEFNWICSIQFTMMKEMKTKNIV